MVEFITLFLAMVWGPTEVGVAVDQRVAAVELLLDGQPVGRIQGEPWTLRVDFGEDLLPHDLEAVALDGAGRVIGRAQQWINYGRGLVDARWAVDPGEGWPPKRARLIWESIDGVAPSHSKVLFDEQSLQPGEDGWVDLPRYDPRETHFLSAELSFWRSQEARADLVFGGVFGESVDTELSSVVLLLPEGAPVPSPEEASRWVQTEDGASVRITSVESGAAFIALVKDRRLTTTLPVSAKEQFQKRSRRPKKLRRDDQLFFIQTSATASPHRPGTALFRPYAVADPYRGRGLLYAARRLAPPEDQEALQQIFDAVAIAGRQAARSGRPRGVLWLRGPEDSVDRSLLEPAQVRRYLSALQVPLTVWQRESEVGLVEAVSEVHALLARQVVLWVEGRYLPQAIGLSAAAPEGVHLAGGGE